MGKYTRNCSTEGVGEVALMEVVRTRATATATVTAAEEAVVNSGSEKRRKVSNGELRLTSSMLIPTETRGREDIVTTPENFEDESCAAAGSLNSGGVPASCSSNGAMEKLKAADLEEEGVEFGTVASHNSDRSDSTPTSEFMAETGKLDSTITSKPSPALLSSRHSMPAEKLPPAAELEEFFTAAEKDLHNRFKDKYNFDIVNDVPLKGRFEWVQLK